MFFFSDGMLHEYDLEIVKNNKWRFSNQNDNNVSEEAFKKNVILREEIKHIIDSLNW